MGQPSLYPTIVGCIRYRIIGTKPWSTELFHLLSHRDFAGVIDIPVESGKSYMYEVGCLPLSFPITTAQKALIISRLNWDKTRINRYFINRNNQGPQVIAFGSCHYTKPESPVSTMLELAEGRGLTIDQLGDSTFQDVSTRLAGRNVQLVGHLGDQVYVDYLKSLEGAYKYKEIKALYDDSFNHPSKSLVLASFPNAMIGDDHEVQNDYRCETYFPLSVGRVLITPRCDENTCFAEEKSPDTEEEKSELELFRKRHWNAMSNYEIYQLMMTPAYDPMTGRINRYYYSYDRNGHHYFWLDCRNYRTDSFEGKTLFGMEQRQALIDWLVQHKDSKRLKFVFIPVPAFPDYPPNFKEYKDKLSGFPDDREAIFEAIAQNNINGVVFCGGDVHFCTTGQVKLENSNLIVTSIVASPWYWPCIYTALFERHDPDKDPVLLKYTNSNGVKRVFKYINRSEPVALNNYAIISIISSNQIKLEQVIYGQNGFYIVETILNI